MNPEDVNMITYGYNSITETHDITQTTINRDVSYNETKTERTVTTTRTTTTTTVQRNPGGEPIVNTTQTVSSSSTVQTISQIPDPDCAFAGSDMQSTIETISSTETTFGDPIVDNNPDLSGSEFDTMNAAVGKLHNYVLKEGGASGGNWITDDNAFQTAMKNAGVQMTYYGGISTLLGITLKNKNLMNFSVKTAIIGLAIQGTIDLNEIYKRRNVDNIRLRVPN